MPGLIWTASALRDLTDLDTYLIEQDAGSSAVRILDSVSAAAGRLCEYPAIGRSLGENVRVWRTFGTPYVLLYTIEQEEVAILRVLHERRNWRDDGFSRA
ncbi:hypothetical protein ASE67_05510 [Sphingomonas sp. Leaf23]|uniref:type II toxin-antitoxin system RelE/ParE family toxin n=1 Tax=Sphingomonas sp. Leaf23 TaxID=1735689 RepID=UPI000701A8F2|nr:type II toxin-antitoxin system RelE/ParE family toxin [Sphingomonas sp. Leaf23]KQM87192.1 hypothetical protein ASE67_05510 [Sphingomonas sp. Leaf23]